MSTTETQQGVCDIHQCPAYACPNDCPNKVGGSKSAKEKLGLDLVKEKRREGLVLDADTQKALEGANSKRRGKGFLRNEPDNRYEAAFIEELIKECGDKYLSSLEAKQSVEARPQAKQLLEIGDRINKGLRHAVGANQREKVEQKSEITWSFESGMQRPREEDVALDNARKLGALFEKVGKGELYWLKHVFSIMDGRSFGYDVDEITDGDLYLLNTVIFPAVSAHLENGVWNKGIDKLNEWLNEKNVEYDEVNLEYVRAK